MYPSEMEEKPFNPTNLHKDTMEAILLKKGVCVCVCVVKNLPANVGDRGSIPGPGGFHML